MASAARILKYPQELTNHLKKLSTEKDDECKIYAQWDFNHTEDSGEADSQCPCGKTGIRYLCYITNKITKKSTFVGTSCVEFFDEEMKEVLKLVLNLISVGITGKYKGEGVGGKKRFEIRANTTSCKERVTLESSFPKCSSLPERKREMGDASIYRPTRLYTRSKLRVEDPV